MDPCPFGAILLGLLKDRGLSQNAFSKLVGAQVQTVNAIIAGKRGMPLAQVDRWAEALGLKGPARREFEIEATLTVTPALIREEFLKLRGQVAKGGRSGRPT